MQRALTFARAGFCSALFFAVLGCAARPTEGYRLSKSAGDRAYSAGRYEDAAGAYAAAQKAADRPRDVAESLYLEAASYQRQRSWDRARAAYERLTREGSGSHWAARAEFDLADLEIDAGNPDKGYDAYRLLTTKYPNDGLARRALERYTQYLKESGGDPVAWIGQLLPQIAGTDLDESARYTQARWLAAAEDRQGARAAYVACAERHPYPKGSLFDDALWNASLLDEEMGKPDQAIADLRMMLTVRETSTMTGSYERPRFSPAQFRIAVLYRDVLKDRAAARREFRKLYDGHPTSTLRDDALWEEAKLASDDGHASESCALATTLVREFPTSRYAPCVRSICPTAPPSAGRCHSYLVRGASND